jgi:hypothetical protein
MTEGLFSFSSLQRNTMNTKTPQKHRPAQVVRERTGFPVALMDCHTFQDFRERERLATNHHTTFFNSGGRGRPSDQVYGHTSCAD